MSTPKKPRISKTGLTSGGRYAAYSNSKEVTDLDPSLVNYLQGNSLTPLYLTQAEMGDEEFSVDDLVQIEIDNSEGNVSDSQVSEVEKSTLRPSLSDISIVSNTVVYDSAGNPSVTLVVKIKNSSGVELKGMNARITLV
jgi:hypothetical protein